MSIEAFTLTTFVIFVISGSFYIMWNFKSNKRLRELLGSIALAALVILTCSMLYTKQIYAKGELHIGNELNVTSLGMVGDDLVVSTDEEEYTVSIENLIIEVKEDNFKNPKLYTNNYKKYGIFKAETYYRLVVNKEIYDRLQGKGSIWKAEGY